MHGWQYWQLDAKKSGEISQYCMHEFKARLKPFVSED
jgi:hypothetical protein